MPVSSKLVPFIITAIVIVWLCCLSFKNSLRRIKEKKANQYLISFSGLYLLYFIGTLYTENLHGRSGALFDLEVKLSLLLFPLIFSTIDISKLKKDFFIKVQNYFVAGSVLSTIVILINAILLYLENQNTDVFYYVKLSMGKHPSYLALYFTFAIAILLNQLVFRGVRKPIRRYFLILIILYLEVFIVLLSSKAGILGLVLMFFIFFTLAVIRAKIEKPRKLLIVTSSLVFFLFTLYISPKSYSRFFIAKNAFADDFDEVNGNLDGKISRVLIWDSSLEILKENYLIGVGTGDVIPELKKIYYRKDLTSAAHKSLNPHNQYLQTTIAIGLPGLIFLLTTLILPMIISLKRKKHLYFVFLCLMIFHMLVESMLELQAGVTFYAYFNSFLFCFTFIENKSNLMPSET